ncbi:unnamed protein product [Anisakis simplex]|uniref:Uncharacterized protein n=1 Tax=Anisakis simplex TaxID=6269 RepID=A0A0M3KAQ8_ANISI|nr:unnamed protein product [Anisakis simplex]
MPPTRGWQEERNDQNDECTRISLDNLRRISGWSKCSTALQEGEDVRSRSTAHKKANGTIINAKKGAANST